MVNFFSFIYSISCLLHDVGIVPDYLGYLKCFKGGIKRLN